MYSPGFSLYDDPENQEKLLRTTLRCSGSECHSNLSTFEAHEALLLLLHLAAAAGREASSAAGPTGHFLVSETTTLRDKGFSCVDAAARDRAGRANPAAAVTPPARGEETATAGPHCRQAARERGLPAVISELSETARRFGRPAQTAPEITRIA
ncbi:hypothetical protein HPB47_012031 [Ixodes persulcatus]|uniref:Uncharacterized protein n=1 Tax=Ixodes persulcatus TaxID=34615 RepID=A0AC60NUP8_IXOPE|nr:hypothetical protein HPB47_012031 [Ixodes persulcatus]